MALTAQQASYDYGTGVISPGQLESLQTVNPASPNMLVDYKKFKGDPAKVTAELTRKQWEDYQNRFMPIENQVMALASYQNPGIVSDQINAAVGAGGYVSRALDASRGSQDRAFARYGISPNAAQRQALNRQAGLTKSLAMVDSANKIRQKIIDRDQLIATGNIPNAGRSYGLKTEA